MQEPGQVSGWFPKCPATAWAILLKHKCHHVLTLRKTLHWSHVTCRVKPCLCSCSHMQIEWDVAGMQVAALPQASGQRSATPSCLGHSRVPTDPHLSGSSSLPGRIFKTVPECKWPLRSLAFVWYHFTSTHIPLLKAGDMGEANISGAGRWIPPSLLLCEAQRRRE